MNLLTDPWPWYVGGPLIGLTVPLLLLEESWNLFFVAGVLIGSCLAMNVFATDSFALLPEHYRSPQGLAMLFAGGLLVGFGTRYADGCTSGHSIMGMSSLKWPSLVATLSFFVGGLVLTGVKSLV